MNFSRPIGTLSACESDLQLTSSRALSRHFDMKVEHAESTLLVALTSCQNNLSRQVLPHAPTSPRPDILSDVVIDEQRPP